MLTLQEANKIVKESSRCTEAVMLSFGIKGIIPHFGSGILTSLKDKGFNVKCVSRAGTLKHFRRKWESKTMCYVILYPTHAVSIIKGVKIDTAYYSEDKRVYSIWQIWKDSDENF